MTQQPWPGTAPQAPEDPFDISEKVPAISFDKDANGNRLNPPVTYELEVLDSPKQVQSRSLETGQLEYFTNQFGQPTDPKWDVVISVRLNGEKRGLWCKKWNKEGTLFRAIADAQAAAGQRIMPGGKLTVQWYATEAPPKDKPAFNGQKLYRAKYEPNVFPVAPAGGDPFAPAQAPAPAQGIDPAAQAARLAANNAAVAPQVPAGQWQPPAAPPQPTPSPQPVQAPPADPWADSAPPF